MMKIVTPYYEDSTRYSNSNIGQYLKYGPQYLRDYLDKKEDGLSASFLEKGSMIHMYILQPEEFWKEYTILEYEVPKVNQQKILCSSYCYEKKVNPFESEDTILLLCYNEAYNNSKSDNVKIQEAKDIISKYGDYIKNIDNPKKAISFADLQMLKKIKTNLEEHKFSKSLLFDLPENIEVHNEFHINWEYPREFYDTYLPCKSLIDRVHIDEKNKVITLIDLKTTSTLYGFDNSMITYDYCRQFRYYWMALEWYMKNERGIDIMEYTRKTYVIAISSTGSGAVRVFNVTESQMAESYNTIDNTIKELSWHDSKGKWQYKREYYEGDGIEQLDIQSIKDK